MSAGFIGSDLQLWAMAKKEGHPNPTSVKSFTELLNWVWSNKINQKEQKTATHRKRRKKK